MISLNLIICKPIAKPGKTIHLLKIKSKGQKSRKKQKKHPANYQIILDAHPNLRSVQGESRAAENAEGTAQPEVSELNMEQDAREEDKYQ